MTTTFAQQTHEGLIAFREFVSTAGSGATIDREAGIVRNVKLLGRESKNGRIYSDKAMREAAALYIGKPIFFDHNVTSATNRKYGDRFGEVLTATVRPTGVFGDFRYNKKHPLAEQVLHDIEANTEGVGFSPDHYGNGPLDNRGSRMVETIRLVKSLDIVANPATNHSFSESVTATPARQATTRHRKPDDPWFDRHGREIRQFSRSTYDYRRPTAVARMPEAVAEPSSGKRFADSIRETKRIFGAS